MTENASGQPLRAVFNRDQSEELIQYVRDSLSQRLSGAINVPRSDHAWAKEYAYTVREMLENNPDQLQNLSVEVRVALLEASNSLNFADPELNELLVSGINLLEDSGYRLWKTNQAVELSEAVMSNGLLSDRLSDWSSLRQSEKLAVMRSVVQMDAEMRGYPAPHVTGADLSQVQIGGNYEVSCSKFQITGLYNSEDNTIELSDSFMQMESPLLFANGQEALSTVVHEGEHAFQAELVRKYETVRVYERRFFEGHVEENATISPDEDQDYYEHMSAKFDSMALSIQERGIYEQLILGGALRNAAAAFKYQKSMDALQVQTEESYLASVTENDAFDHEILVDWASNPEQETENAQMFYDGVQSGQVQKNLERGLNEVSGHAVATLSGSVPTI